MERKSGFTLIELLIVVAIIAILAAIAVPNFLEAQMRAKVSASKADLRALALAIECYSVDWDSYPFYPYYNPQFDPSFTGFYDTGFMGSDNPETCRLYSGYTPVSLTTPLAYMTMLPQDVFAYAKRSWSPDHYKYENTLQLYQYEQHRSPVVYTYWDDQVPEGVHYGLYGVGPDTITVLSSIAEGDRFHNNAHEYLQIRRNAISVNGFYDPTNGMLSWGDIVYFGPGMGFEPLRLRVYNP